MLVKQRRRHVHCCDTGDLWALDISEKQGLIKLDGFRVETAQCVIVVLSKLIWYTTSFLLLKF